MSESILLLIIMFYLNVFILKIILWIIFVTRKIHSIPDLYPAVQS